MSLELLAFETSPKPQSGQVVDFERAEVRTLESFPPQYLLVVSGMRPCLNMRVELMPLVYIQQPEYWGIEVVGFVPGGLCLPALSSYTVDLLNPPLGTKGIEVIGATRRERFVIPPDEEAPQGTFVLSITSKGSGELVSNATLTCNPDGGSHPHAKRACEQLSTADGRIEAIPADEGPCTREFNPVILQASGTWNGEDRRFRGDYPNPCVGIRATGGVVFDFASEEA